MSLAIKLASHNITVPELRLYLDLFRSKQFPIILLESMVTITQSGQKPSSFCFFESSESYIRSDLLAQQIWPPSRGIILAISAL